MKPSWFALSLSLALATAFSSASQAQISGADQINLPSFGAPAGSGELSPADERKIGEKYMREIRESRFYLDDPDSIEYLTRLGYRLVSHAPVHPYSFVFFPLKAGEINAFALPGGFIAIFSGTILAANDESELAGVVAHEIAHVTQRHIARMFENDKGTFALALGSFLLAILAASAGGSSGGNAAAAVMAGSQAAMVSNRLKFSRSAEREADRLGFQIMVGAGFDPEGMPRFFQSMQKRTRQYESNSYLSDHPLTVERIADMENRARQFRTSFRERDELDFLLMQSRMRVLQSTKYDSLLAAREDMRRHLSEKGLSGAAFRYGLSLAEYLLGNPTEAYREARVAAELAGRPNVYLDKHLAQMRFYGAQSRQEKEAALEDMRALSERNPLSVMVMKAYVEELYAVSDHERILKFLKEQGAISTESEEYYRLTARSYSALGKRSEAFLATGKMQALQNNWKLAAAHFRQAQSAADGDFFTMSEIDASLREAEERIKEESRALR